MAKIQQGHDPCGRFAADFVRIAAGHVQARDPRPRGGDQRILCSWGQTTFHYPRTEVSIGEIGNQCRINANASWYERGSTRASIRVVRSAAIAAFSSFSKDSGVVTVTPRRPHALATAAKSTG